MQSPFAIHNLSVAVAESPFSTRSSDSDSSSPRSEKLVNVCRNCSFSYRLSRRNTAEYCSKDCQTNHTLFGASTPSKASEKTAAEVRFSIYEFQKQLDEEYDISVLDSATKPAQYDTEDVIAADPYPFPPKVDKAAKKTPAKKSTFFEAIFTTPLRSARPQLHAFI